MLKDEKKILNSPALDTPDKSVLQDAKAYMPKKKGVNTRLARILAPIACVIVVAVVLGMIPAMIPANSGDPNYISLNEMIVETIDSIASFNMQNGTDLLCFDNHTNTYSYSYLGKIMLLEETVVVDGVEVSILVEINKNVGDYHFEATYKYDRGLTIAQRYTICGRRVLMQQFEGMTYLSFTHEDNKYFLIIDSGGDESVWQNIFEKLIN